MLEVNKIYQGDCFTRLNELDDNSVDLVVTDPPYGISYSSFRTNSKIIQNDSNLLWVEDFIDMLNPKTKIDSHLYMFVDFEFMPEFLLALRKYYKIRNLLKIPRCIKGNGGDRIFQQQDEYCIFATKGKGRRFNESQILKPSEGYLKDKRYKAKEWLYRLPDRWDWTTASIFNHDRLHPNQKNVSCLKDMIILSSNVGDLVLDPFMGSGSTAIACIETQRSYIGFELDDTYYKTSNERIIKHAQLNKERTV